MYKRQAKQIKYGRYLHGGDYNPEQWLAMPEILEQDIEYMKEAHINEVTLGVFSWSVLEPEEGVYHLEWLEKIMDQLYKNEISVILSTPSAARPKWLADKYPEVLRVNADRTKNLFGGRHNHCYTSPVYREKVGKIDRLLSEKFGKHPAVKMWHISNELSGECHCPLCQKAFQGWLKKKYQTIETLNKAWGTVFWSETLDNFEQVWLPRRMDNPGIYQDYQRFYSDVALEFFRIQRDVVKAVAPGMTVTTNIGGSGFVTTMNLYELADECDVLSFDNYPVNVTLEHLYGNDIGHPFDPAMTSFAMQIIRGGKPRPIWVPEAQIGRTALTQKEIVKEGYPRLWNHVYPTFFLMRLSVASVVFVSGAQKGRD